MKKATLNQNRPLNFQKQHYLASKTKVIEMIKETHPSWETTEGFMMDGVFCPEVFEAQTLKVLVILGESYGYGDQGDAYDYVDQAIDNDMIGLQNSGVQTPRKVAALLWLLLGSLKAGKPIEDSQWPYQFQINPENMSQLQGVLSRIAWINVKKASNNSGSTRQDYGEIYSNAERNKEILRLQISSIAPDLMIVCSDAVFDGLFDNGLLGEGIETGKKWEVQTNHVGQRIMQVNHPSYFRDWGYEGVYGTFEILYRSIKHG